MLQVLAVRENAEFQVISADGMVAYGRVGDITNGNTKHLFIWEKATGLVTTTAIAVASDVYGEASLSKLCCSEDGGVLFYREASTQRVYRRTLAGAVTDFGGGTNSVHGCSRMGTVAVGKGYNTAVSTWRGWRWTTGAGVVHLGTLGGQRSEAYGCSHDGGVAVGRAQPAGETGDWGTYRPVRWLANGQIEDLGAPAGASGVATACSSDGSIVVGNIYLDSVQRAFRWTVAGGYQELSPDYVADSVSADGSVVVGHYAGDSGRRAFRWTAAEGLQDLGHVGGYGGYQLMRCSDAGDVVVGRHGNGPDPIVPFYWSLAAGLEPETEFSSSGAAGTSGCDSSGVTAVGFITTSGQTGTFAAVFSYTAPPPPPPIGSRLRKTPLVTHVPGIVGRAYRAASTNCYPTPPSGTGGDSTTPPPTVPPGGVTPAAGTPILLEHKNGSGGYTSSSSTAPAPSGYTCRYQTVYVVTPGAIFAVQYNIVCTQD